MFIATKGEGRLVRFRHKRVSVEHDLYISGDTNNRGGVIRLNAWCCFIIYAASMILYSLVPSLCAALANGYAGCERDWGRGLTLHNYQAM